MGKESLTQWQQFNLDVSRFGTLPPHLVPDRPDRNGVQAYLYEAQR